jgi:hypothetical protein
MMASRKVEGQRPDQEVHIDVAIDILRIVFEKEMDSEMSSIPSYSLWTNDSNRPSRRQKKDIHSTLCQATHS